MKINSEIDEQALQELVDMLGADGFQLAFLQFRKDVDRLLNALDAATNEADLNQVWRLAHSLKGLLIQFGATGPGMIAMATQNSAPGETLRLAASLTTSVRQTIPRLVSLVETGLASGRPLHPDESSDKA